MAIDTEFLFFVIVIFFVGTVAFILLVEGMITAEIKKLSEEIRKPAKPDKEVP